MDVFSLKIGGVSRGSGGCRSVWWRFFHGGVEQVGYGQNNPYPTCSFMCEWLARAGAVGGAVMGSWCAVLVSMVMQG